MSDTKTTSTPQSPDEWPEPLGSPTLWSPSTYPRNTISTLKVADGLFVDRSFPTGDILQQTLIEWKRPKVRLFKVALFLRGADTTNTKELLETFGLNMFMVRA